MRTFLHTLRGTWATGLAAVLAVTLLSLCSGGAFAQEAQGPRPQAQEAKPQVQEPFFAQPGTLRAPIERVGPREARLLRPSEGAQQAPALVEPAAPPQFQAPAQQAQVQQAQVQQAQAPAAQQQPAAVQAQPAPVQPSVQQPLQPAQPAPAQPAQPTPAQSVPGPVPEAQAPQAPSAQPQAEPVQAPQAAPLQQAPAPQAPAQPQPAPVPQTQPKAPEKPQPKGKAQKGRAAPEPAQPVQSAQAQVPAQAPAPVPQAAPLQAPPQQAAPQPSAPAVRDPLSEALSGMQGDTVRTPGGGQRPATSVPVPQGVPQRPQPTDPQAPNPGLAQNAIFGVSPPQPSAPDVSTLLTRVRADQVAGDYENARRILEYLRDRPDVSFADREEVLYELADAYMAIGRKDLQKDYQRIYEAYQNALNFNTSSARLPHALLQLGLLNLRLGNAPEARGYFNVLKNKYPNDDNAASADYYWGEYYFSKGDFQKAADAFNTIVQKHPNSKFIREASVGLARTQARLGQYSQADGIVEHVMKRWPRIYVDIPVILRLQGDLAWKTGKYQQAKDAYLQFLNMEPGSEGTDLILSRLGDVYMKLGKKEPALALYAKVVAEYPGSEGALISKMRLAEEGVHDAPTLADMFAAFSKPVTVNPEEIYTEIVKDAPDSPLAPLAQLKLAMWYLYNADAAKTLDAVEAFLKRFPDSELAGQAREVGLTAFSRLVANLVREEYYRRITDTWFRYPFLSENPAALPDRTVMGVGLALYRMGDARSAVDLVRPYLGEKQNEASEMAAVLLANIYLDRQNWNDAAALGDKVAGWNLRPEYRRQIDFAAAAAKENLGERNQAVGMWARLAMDPKLDAAKKAQAYYFLAKAAQDKGELDKNYAYAAESARLLRESGTDPDKLKDCLIMLVDSSTRLNRIQDALRFSRELETKLGEGSPEWAANRFKMATMYKQMGDEPNWRALLETVAQKMSGSFYGNLAESELRAQSLENSIQQFR